MCYNGQEQMQVFGVYIQKKVMPVSDKLKYKYILKAQPIP